MNTTDRTLLSLVRHSINSNNKLAISGEVDWPSLYLQSSRQGVNALVVDGLQLLMERGSEVFFAEETLKEKSQRMQWFA